MMMKDADEVRAALKTMSAGWTKAQASGEQNCVEVNFEVPGWAGVRDSKLGVDSPVHVFNKTEWDAFLAGVRNGEFDNRIR